MKKPVFVQACFNGRLLCDDRTTDRKTDREADVVETEPLEKRRHRSYKYSYR